ncbi:MAG: metalloregulator ArsR/SmtB family transcription factor [Wenzhouxiangellaceae bacterium]|nr:metalloregulator ArsR/SmtB family transcription factor [Wenzhouxiangellaceae bacterium]
MNNAPEPGVIVDSGDANETATAAVAKALAHPARIRIVRLLLARETCVGGDIVEQVGLAQSTVSEHLRILKAAGVVVGEIERPRICYSLNAAALAPLTALLDEISARQQAGRLGGPPCSPGDGDRQE